MHVALQFTLAPIGAALLVDFLSGVLHWLEDTYGSEHTPFFGRHVTKPNIVHHHEPRAFTHSPFLRRNSVTFLITAVVMTPILLATDAHVFALWVTVFGMFSNEIHCWAHRTPKENGPFITLLQRARLIQSPHHHAIHHTDPKRDCYCVVTDFLNPVLDRVRFFRGVEYVIWWTLRVHPRPDASVKHFAPTAPRPAA